MYCISFTYVKTDRSKRSFLLVKRSQVSHARFQQCESNIKLLSSHTDSVQRADLLLHQHRGCVHPLPRWGLPEAGLPGDQGMHPGSPPLAEGKPAAGETTGTNVRWQQRLYISVVEERCWASFPWCFMLHEWNISCRGTSECAAHLTCLCHVKNDVFVSSKAVFFLIKPAVAAMFYMYCKLTQQQSSDHRLTNCYTCSREMQKNRCYFHKIHFHSWDITESLWVLICS